MTIRTTQETVQFGYRAEMYARYREVHPTMPASIVLAAVNHDSPKSIEQFICGATDGGHGWPRGIEEWERWLCSYCGADGDA